MAARQGFVVPTADQQPSGLSLSLPAPLALALAVPSSPSPSPNNADGGRAREATGAGSFIGRSAGRTILPPLPPQGPSPTARSSSPRYHSSSSSSAAPAPMPARNGAAAPGYPPTPSQRRLETLLTWHVRNSSDMPYEWDDDSVAGDAASLVPSPSLYDGLYDGLSDEQFLSALVDHEFSSPVATPSLTAQSPLRPGFYPAQASNQQLPSRQPAAAAAPGTSAAAPRPPQPPPRYPDAARDHLNRPQNLYAALSRSNTQLTDSSRGESQNTLSLADYILDDSLPETQNTSFSDAMPLVRSRAGQPEPAVPRGPMANKRRRTTPAAELRPASRHSAFGEQRCPAALDSDDDLFGDSPPGPGTRLSSKLEDYTTIDLTEATEVPAELTKPDADNRIKLSTFQCVICMDDATALTVTHCGHMYCAQCLHSSLNVEATKGKCPMCRTKIDMKPRASYTSKTKGFWHLELKLMTATRKGKRKADALL